MKTTNSLSKKGVSYFLFENCRGGDIQFTKTLIARSGSKKCQSLRTTS